MAESLREVIPYTSLSMIAARMSVQATSLILALCAFTAEACAQDLRDPTRPPASLAVALDAAPEPNLGPRLQSVLIAPGRRVAIVSGQTVEVGGEVGEARVVSISEGQVVLRNGKDLQTLRLFPEVEKHLASGIAISKSRFGSQPVKDK